MEFFIVDNSSSTQNLLALMTGQTKFRGGGGKSPVQAGKPGNQKPSDIKRESMTDSIYVGQLPADIKENDLKKLFPKAKTVTLTSADGKRPG